MKKYFTPLIECWQDGWQGKLALITVLSIILLEGITSAHIARTIIDPHTSIQYMIACIISSVIMLVLLFITNRIVDWLDKHRDK